MSSSANYANDGDIRLGIYLAIREGCDTVGEIVTAVADDEDCPESAVTEQMQVLEDNGLLFRDSDDSDAEVRLP